MRERHRIAHGRKLQPTAVIVTRRRMPDIDSHSTRTTEAGVPRGYDGGKKVSGRKRYILVDTEGNLPKACAHPADIHDPLGGSEAASSR